MEALTNRETPGQRIQRLRKASEYVTLDNLAAAVGTTRQIIIGWEKDKHEPRPYFRRRLAEKLGGHPDDYARGDAGDAEGD